jgi:hypothetical protein
LKTLRQRDGRASVRVQRFACSGDVDGSGDAPGSLPLRAAVEQSTEFLRNVLLTFVLLTVDGYLDFPRPLDIQHVILPTISTVASGHSGRQSEESNEYGAKIGRTMIRAILFDLDGTLYDRDAAVLRIAEEQFETFRPNLTLRNACSQTASWNSMAMVITARRASTMNWASPSVLVLISRSSRRPLSLKYPHHCQISEDSREHTRNIAGAWFKAWHYHERADALAESQD